MGVNPSWHIAVRKNHAARSTARCVSRTINCQKLVGHLSVGFTFVYRSAFLPPFVSPHKRGLPRAPCSIRVFRVTGLASHFLGVDAS